MSEVAEPVVNVSSKSGHARMATTQDAFRKEIEKRLREVRGAIRKTIVDNDFLRIQDQEPRKPRDLVNLDPGERFEFDVDNDVEAFNRWLGGALEDGFVQSVDRDELMDGRHWTSVHVDSGYEEGLKWSNVRAKDAGVLDSTESIATTLKRPVHRDTLETLYGRTFEQVDGFAVDAKRDINRILTEKVAEGVNARKIGDVLTQEVRSMQRSRGRAIARTEVMNAFTQATGNRYKEFGVKWVDILTYDPCPQCQAYAESGPHKVEEASATLPLHPNCVCSMAPAKNPPDSDETRAGPETVREGSLGPVQRAPRPDDIEENWQRTQSMRMVPSIDDVPEGRTVDEMADEALENLRESAKDNVDDFVGSSEVRIRANESVIRDVVRDGRYKTQFETNSSGGIFDPDMRRNFERELFDLDDDVDVTERPIYGYLRKSGVPEDETYQLDSYGKSVIRLKDDVRERSTFVASDSIEANQIADEVETKIYKAPSPVNDPQTESFGIRDLRKIAEESVNKPKDFPNYVEAQVHGGVSIDDIKSVDFVKEPAQETVEILDERNIDWTVIQ